MRRLRKLWVSVKTWGWSRSPSRGSKRRVTSNTSSKQKLSSQASRPQLFQMKLPSEEPRGRAMVQSQPFQQNRSKIFRTRSNKFPVEGSHFPLRPQKKQRRCPKKTNRSLSKWMYLPRELFKDSPERIQKATQIYAVLFWL